MRRIIRLLPVLLFMHPFILYAMSYYSIHHAERYPTQDSIPILSEIIVEGKKKRIRIKNDTTIFNVAAFRDGTEKKIEELMAKLPGISVNPENGIISYQGRTVEAVKIDGADLLGSNYMTGTRNISIDIIEEIEAVTNDPANPLLKSMQSGGKMILNLRTKNNVASSNYELSFGAGSSSEHRTPVDAQFNLLRLSKRIKIFKVASFNNRGVNNGSSNYFQSVQHNDISNNTASFAESFFDHLLPVLPLDHHRYHINNMRMVNSNLLFQPGGDHHTFRINFSLMQDRRSAGYDHLNQYDPAINAAATSDRFSVKGMPLHGASEIQWNKLLARNIWFAYSSYLQRAHHRSDFTQLLNDSLLIRGRFHTAHVAQTHTLDFTYRFNDRFLWRSELRFAQDRLPETLIYDFRENHLMPTTRQTQHTKSGLSVFDYKSSLTLKQRKYLCDFETGFQFRHLSFYSLREERDENGSHLNDAHNNNQIQQHRIIYQSAGLTVHHKNITLNLKSALQLHSFSWISPERGIESRRYMRAAPYLTITQKIGSLLKWIHQLGWNNEPVTNKAFVHHPLLISSRIQLRHEIAPQLQRHVHGSSRLLYQNLFRQQSAQVGFHFSVIDKSQVADMKIDERNIITGITMASVPQIRGQINGQYEVFLRALGANFVIDANAGQFNYYNQVNVKSLRENIAENLTLGLQCNSSFRFPVNVFYRFSLNQTFIKSEQRRISGNQILNHSLRMIWRKGKILFTQLSADAVRVNGMPHQTHLFLDLLMTYKPIRKKYLFTLVGKNLLDQRYFTQWQISDYGKVLTQTRLLPAYLMLQAEYRF